MANLEATLSLRDRFTDKLKKIDDGLKKATKGMDDFKSKVAGPAKALGEFASTAQSAMSKFNSGIRTGLTSATSIVKSSVERILSMFGSFGNSISSKLNLNDVTGKFTSAFGMIRSKVSDGINGVGNIVKSLGSKISSGFSGAVNAVKNGTAKIGSFLKQSGGAFKQYGNDVRDSFDKMRSSASSASNGFRSMVSAIGVTKAIGAAINVVKASVGSAVDRFDTLNQFPKVMQMWGYSAKEASNSTDKMLTGIDGLPTTLNDITGNVQTLVTSGLGLGNATDVALALNNALLANSSSSETASSAMEQYTQMLAVGKVDQMAWNSLVRGAGKTIDTMAKELLGANANQADLYSAMQNGTITFDQFNTKLTELNEATGGLAEQALIGSEGVKTSMGILKTAVTNGVTGSIEKVDQLLMKLNGKSLAQNIASFKPVISDVFGFINTQFDKLPALIGKVMPYVDVLKNSFKQMKKPITEAVDAVRDSLTKLTGDFGSDQSIKGFQGFVDGVVDSVSKLASFVEKHSEPIAKFISILPKLAGAFIGFKIGKGVLSPLVNFGSGILGVIKATGKLGGGLGAAFGGLFKKMPTMPKGPKDGPLSMFDTKSFTKQASSFQNTLKSFAKSAAGIALVFGVIKLIEAAAEALKVVNDKVPKDLSVLGPKLLNMGIALAGMGAFVTIAGKLAKKNPKEAIGGLLAVAGISANLLLAAEAMEQINNKVPSDVGDFALKMASMAIAIGGMTVLVAAVGAVMSTGIGAIVLGGGLVTVALIAFELMLVAEAIQQMDKKVPADLSAATGKIDNIAKIIQHFTNANLGGILDIFSNAVGVINTAVVISGINKFSDLALALGEFARIEVPSGVDIKIKEIQQAIKAMDGSSIKDVFGSLLTDADLGIVKKSIVKLIDLSRSLSTLGDSQLNTTTIEANINKIKDAISFLSDSDGIFEKLKGLVSKKIGSSVFETAKGTFTQLVGIGDSLATLQAISFDFDSVKENIIGINEAINTLGTSGISEVIGGMVKASQLTQAKESLTALHSLFDPINLLSNTEVVTEGAIAKIAKINLLIERLGTATFGEVIGMMLQTSELNRVKSTLTSMLALYEPINALSNADVQTGPAIEKINLIKGVIEQLNNFPEIVGIVGLQMMITTFMQLSSSLQQFVGIATVSIAGLSAVSSAFTSNMSTMQVSAATAMAAITASAIAGMISFASAISTGMTTAASTAQQGKENIVNAFSGMYGPLYSAGNYAMEGLAAGINNGAGAAVSAAQRVATQVAEATRKALEVRSPSRVFMAIGKFIPAGLAEGIERAKSLVQRASAALAQATIPSFLADVSASGSVTSNVMLDDGEISRLKASASQKVVVNTKQVSPQVTLYVDNSDGEPIDTDALLIDFENKVIELIESDLG